MTALEYMEQQLRKHQDNFYREFKRGVPHKMLYDILAKISHYEMAVEALRKVGNGNA